MTASQYDDGPLQDDFPVLFQAEDMARICYGNDPIRYGEPTDQINEGNHMTTEVDEHNKAIEARELTAWEAQPDEWNVYIVKRDDGYWAETWLGTKLSTNPVKHNTFRGNIARNMSSVRFRATNGAEYFGRYGSDWAEFCRVRKAKTQR